MLNLSQHENENVTNDDMRILSGESLLSLRFILAHFNRKKVFTLAAAAKQGKYADNFSRRKTRSIIFGGFLQVR